MVRDEHPCVTGRLSLGQEFCQTIKEIRSIPVIYEYLSTLYPTDHDMVQHTGRVQTSLSWHGLIVWPALQILSLKGAFSGAGPVFFHLFFFAFFSR